MVKSESQHLNSAPERHSRLLSRPSNAGAEHLSPNFTPHRRLQLGRPKNWRENWEGIGEGMRGGKEEDNRRLFHEMDGVSCKCGS